MLGDGNEEMAIPWNAVGVSLKGPWYSVYPELHGRPIDFLKKGVEFVDST